MPYSYRGVVPDVTGRSVDTSVFLTSGLYADQNPVGTDSPLIVNFGSNPITTGLVDYDGVGAFTCETSGSYTFNVSYQYGRTTSSGVVYLFGGVLLNGTPLLISRLGKITNGNDDFPAFIPVILDLTVGDVITFDIWRGSEGSDDGGLQSFTPNLAGVPAVPSAFMSITRNLIS